MLNFRKKGKENDLKCLFDPTYQDVNEGMNSLQFSLNLENFEIVEMILEKSRE